MNVTKDKVAFVIEHTRGLMRDELAREPLYVAARSDSCLQITKTYCRGMISGLMMAGLISHARCDELLAEIDTNKIGGAS